MHGDTTIGCVFRVKADVERETRATREVQKTPAPCLPGKDEKIAPVLQATYETTVFFFLVFQFLLK